MCIDFNSRWVHILICRSFVRSLRRAHARDAFHFGSNVSRRPIYISEIILINLRNGANNFVVWKQSNEEKEWKGSGADSDIFGFPLEMLWIEITLIWIDVLQAHRRYRYVDSRTTYTVHVRLHRAQQWPEIRKGKRIEMKTHKSHTHTHSRAESSFRSATTNHQQRRRRQTQVENL